MKRQIMDTIKQYDTIVIHRHVRPDPDAYGSAFGLKELIQCNFPEKQVYVTGEHDHHLSFLATPDEVSDDTFREALVIVTDTANTERIDDERYKTGKKIIKIDHHPNDDAYGDLRWVDTSSSSTSELIFELYAFARDEENWQFTQNGARLLFAGIIGDTGRFMFQSTSEKTFEIAGELIKFNFDRAELFNAMYEVERKILHLQGYMYQNFVMNDSGVAFVKLTKETLGAYDCHSTDASLLVGSLGNVSGIRTWVIFIEEHDQIRVRLRSKGPVINELAKQFGGGGHPLASGATIYSWEEADQVIEQLKKISTN